MADFNAVALNVGQTAQIATSDRLIFGGVVISDNVANAFNISEGSNEYLKIVTTDTSEAINLGNATTNPSLEHLGTGDVKLANGTLDVPAGTSFKIGGIALGTANFTAANINTLLDGSNADALHTHSISSATSVTITGLTTTGVAVGEAAYISADDTCLQARANAEATSKFAGVVSAAGSLVVSGKVTAAKFEAGLSPAPVAGDLIFLSETTAGLFTNDASSLGSGDRVVECGWVLNASAYGASQECDIVLMKHKQVALV